MADSGQGGRAPGWAQGLIAALLALSVGACGGDPPKAEGKEAKKEAAAAPGAPGEAAPAAVAGMENYIVLGENKTWTPIKSLFDAYAIKEIDGVTDFSLNNLTFYIEKPVIQGKSCPPENPDCDKSTIVDKGEPPELDDSCATKAPLERYGLIILMSGIPTPKAVLTDASGAQCEVVRGDGLGTEGGRVTAITQYKLIVNQPGKEKPIVLSIAPPISVDDALAQEAEPL
ncbi:MAG: hypothetical protein EXR77_07545 [Myxococcales bacterium]|nr:hypothetical protein [Myxococcales bacterium]